MNIYVDYSGICRVLAFVSISVASIAINTVWNGSSFIRRTNAGGGP